MAMTSDGESGSSLVVGVDIGGTKVAAGLVRCDGEVVRRAEFPMHLSRSAAGAMACVHAVIGAVLIDSPNLRCLAQLERGRLTRLSDWER